VHDFGHLRKNLAGDTPKIGRRFSVILSLLLPICDVNSLPFSSPVSLAVLAQTNNNNHHSFTMPSNTPYKNADDLRGDGFIREGPIGSNGSGGDFYRLHRDYLQGLDSSVVRKLPWSTLEDRGKIEKLLQQREWANMGWSKAFTGVLYSLMTSIIVIVLFVPRIRRGEDQEMGREWLRVVTVCLAAWNTLLILGTMGLYGYYAHVDKQIQQMVRKLMDETGIGVPFNDAPIMTRDDSNQQAVFELPEFINVMWQRASRTPSQYGGGSSAGPPPSDQISNITF
jgi:hypothetical protein